MLVIFLRFYSTYIVRNSDNQDVPFATAELYTFIADTCTEHKTPERRVAQKTLHKTERVQPAASKYETKLGPRTRMTATATSTKVPQHQRSQTIWPIRAPQAEPLVLPRCPHHQPPTWQVVHRDRVLLCALECN